MVTESTVHGVPTLAPTLDADALAFGRHLIETTDAVCVTSFERARGAWRARCTMDPRTQGRWTAPAEDDDFPLDAEFPPLGMDALIAWCATSSDPARWQALTTLMRTWVCDADFEFLAYGLALGTLTPADLDDPTAISRIVSSPYPGLWHTVVLLTARRDSEFEDGPWFYTEDSDSARVARATWVERMRASHEAILHACGERRSFRAGITAARGFAQVSS